MALEATSIIRTVHKWRTLTMTTEFTAIIQKDGDWWIGWIEEIPGVNAQERTREELIISLREAAKDILDLNRSVAKEAAGKGFEEIPLTV